MNQPKFPRTFAEKTRNLRLSFLVVASALAVLALSNSANALPGSYGGSDVWVHPPTSAAIQSTSSTWRNGNTVVVLYSDLSGGSTGKGSYSTDGGTTFTRLPGDPFATGHGTVYGDPNVVYDVLHARWIATFLVGGCGSLGIGAWTSPDGSTWSPVACVHNNSGMGDDLPHAWEDNNPSSPYYGRTYIAYNDFGTSPGGLRVVFSTNGGATWSSPFIASGAFYRNSGITGLSSGRVVLAGMDEGGGGAGSHQNWFFLSDDGGMSWRQVPQGLAYPPLGNTVCNGNTYWRVITPQIRYMGWGQPAAGPNNVLHYAYTGHGSGPDEGDILYVRSTDGGLSWSDPLRLNSDVTGRAQWMPSLAVTDEGAVFVSWYDRRNTPNNDYWRYGRASLDNGATWQADMAVSDTAIPQPTVQTASCYMGDYDYWHANGTNVQGAWTDSRASGGTQDVFYDSLELQAFYPTPTPTRTPLPDYPIVINELDADQASIDSGEFVELYDGGIGNSSLTGMVVVFYSGANDLSYAAFDLDGYSTDAAGYFTLGNAAVPGVDLVFPGNTLQNGADAVAFYLGDASQFPNGTPITTDNLLDAVVYDTSDPDDAGLLTLLNPGQPQVDENGLGNGTTVSIGRCPNGGGGSHNTDTYTQTNPSPDGPNDAAGVGTFTNPTRVVIPTPAVTPTSAVTPYPSNITVSGLTGTVADVNISFNSVSHTFPDEMDVLLVGPGGQNAIVMSDVGGSTAVVSATIALDDEAPSPIADAGPLVAGIYQPTNINDGTDTWPAPAPAPSGGSALSVFDGTAPNGTWSLYVYDDTTGNYGEFGQGWSITITTSTGSCGNTTASPTATAAATATVNPTATDTPSAMATNTASATATAIATATYTATPSGSPDFSINVTPSSRTVARPASAQYNINISSLNGFSGNVALSVTGLPSQATGSFSPPVVSGGSGSSVLTVTTGKGGPRGTYTLTVTGTSGAIKHTQNITLVITR